jgi:large subunit ribosomal protein L29
MQRAQHISDLRQMEISDLDARLKEVRTELFNLRFQAATGQLENHRQIRQVRRQIAQVLTVIQGRQLGLEEKVAQAPDSAVAPQSKPRRGASRAASAEPETEAGAELETESAAGPETEAAAAPEAVADPEAEAAAEAPPEAAANEPESK